MTDFIFARLQMAVSLAFHIIFAAVGIGMPLLMTIAEGIYLRGVLAPMGVQVEQ
ncbi:MAG: cytochrome ubiquinol oxidase subunit I [Candidatus Bipolaricaulia bacterium]